MVGSFSKFFGEWRVPLDITLLALDEEGRPIGPPHAFTFQFRHRDIPMSAICRNEGETAHLELNAKLGTFPFSAESATARHALDAIIQGANLDFGPVLSVTAGKIRLKAKLPLAMPVTAVELVAALSRFLVPLKPYLDLMAMVRLLP